MVELVVFNDIIVSAYKSKCSFQRSSLAQCEKGEKCVSVSVGSAQTLLEFAGGNTNLTNNNIFQRAHLPKSNYCSHKQISPRGEVICCAVLSWAESVKNLHGELEQSWVMGTVQYYQGACSDTRSAWNFWPGVSVPVSTSSFIWLGQYFPFLGRPSRVSASRMLYSSQKKGYCTV